jgi:hypothetical protein
MHATVFGVDYTIRYNIVDRWNLKKYLDGPARAFVRSSFHKFNPKVTLGFDASKIARSPNAGGASVVSEALSMEVLHKTMMADNVLTELEVSYWSDAWKKVDYICRIDGKRVGVSVTRAMGHPMPYLFTSSDADRLLEKKLYGLVVARAGIKKSQRYDRSILHVWCQTKGIEELVKIAFDRKTVELDIHNDIALFTTIAVNADYLFYDDLGIF